MWKYAKVSPNLGCVLHIRFSTYAHFEYIITMEVEKYIGTSLRIELVDGRQLDGILTVVDPFGNMLLSNVWETSEDKLDSALLRKRELGLVSVPRPQVLKVLIESRYAR